MKKIISLVFILCMVMSAVAVKADAVRDDALGNPILNVNDTAVLVRYPAALQQFPNSIFGVFNGVTNNYMKFGLTYKASDMFGICLSYEKNPTTLALTFSSNGTATVPKSIFSSNAGLAQVSSITYGMKMGDLFAGFSAKTYFFNGITNFQTTSIDSNEKKYKWFGESGFITTFNPSAIIDLAGMNVYATIGSTLNFTKIYSITTNNDKWSRTSTPAVLEDINLSLLAVKKMNDTTSLGLQLKVGMSNTGLTFSDITNGKERFATNSYLKSAIYASVGIGSSIKATESVLIFFDMNTGLNRSSGMHLKGVKDSAYSNTTVYTLPSFTLGTEFELLKNLKLRISAKPTYSLTTVDQASYKGFGAGGNSTSSISAFQVGTQLGLGYKIGSFSINWKLDGQFLNNVLDTPLAFVNIVGGAPTLGSTVQVNYVF